jgi:hypothetical protein
VAAVVISMTLNVLLSASTLSVLWDGLKRNAARSDHPG